MNALSISASRPVSATITPWSTAFAPPDKQISSLQKQIKAEGLSTDDPPTKLAVTQELQTRVQALEHEQEAEQAAAAQQHTATPASSDSPASDATSSVGRNLNLKI